MDASDPRNVQKALRPNTKVVYLETPANPTLAIADLQTISELAHETPGCLVFVDNTFATPYLQRPLEFGADVVLHSATKYLNGHGDVIAGLVLGTEEFIDQVRFFWSKGYDRFSSEPLQCLFDLSRLKTLVLRMERHCANAQKVAEFLETHPAVEAVSYPGLKSHPQYDLVKKNK